MNDHMKTIKATGVAVAGILLLTILFNLIGEIYDYMHKQRMTLAAQDFQLQLSFFFSSALWMYVR